MRRRIILAYSLLISLLAAMPARAADAACTKFITDFTPGINVQRVQQTWLTWINRVRHREGLADYKLNPFLNASATNWSAYSVKRGTIDHKRYAGSPYYDYGAIEKWFGKRGMEFANVDGKTFTENIGWGPYRCDAKDCTSSLIAATRTTLDFFLSEKNKSYRPHYNSVMNKNFKEIGIGVAYSNKQNRYYITVHYATAITSTPPPICK